MSLGLLAPFQTGSLKVHAKCVALPSCVEMKTGLRNPAGAGEIGTVRRVLAIWEKTWTKVCFL